MLSLVFSDLAVQATPRERHERALWWWSYGGRGGLSVDVETESRCALLMRTTSPVVEGSPHQGLSLIRLAEARREFKDVVIGKELDVIPVRKRAAGDREIWLVTAVSTGLLVECESPSGHDLVLNKSIRVEVVRRTEGKWKRIAVVL